MLPRAPFRSALLALGVLCVWGCPAEPDPCQGVSCPEHNDCKVIEGKARCIPWADPCNPDPCAASELCTLASDGNFKCIPKDLCRYAACPADKACDPATGQCTVDKPRCQGIVCPAGEACDPATGACKPAPDKCSALCCNWDEVCNPATGACEPNKCYEVVAGKAASCQCGPTQECEPLTGECLDRPVSCGQCASNQYCDELSGACITIAAGTPAAGEVGAPCTSAAQCTRAGSAAFCLTDDGLFGDMPGGSCSANCDTAHCPAGTGCVNVGMRICLDICRVLSDCRPGYTCTQLTSEDPRTYCFPMGTGSKCTGEGCAGVGQGCEKDDDCVAGAQCATGLPGGYCQISNCRHECDASEANCVCLSTGDCFGSKIALGTCDIRLQDCRPGYSCYALSSGSPVGYCYARGCETDVDCSDGGEAWCEMCDRAWGWCDRPCSTHAECGGGRLCEKDTKRCFQACASAGDNCGPDAFCDMTESGLREAVGVGVKHSCRRKCDTDLNCGDSAYCNLTTGRCIAKCSSDAQCPSQQVCDGRGRCRDRCADDTGCEAFEYCEAGRCQPRCTGVAGCTLGQYCDTSSGRCRRDLSTVVVGASCGRDADCGAYNGTCVTGESWSGGYCTAYDCSTTPGALVPCPSDAACLQGDGGRWRCLKKCVPTAAQPCRPGYACTARGSTNVCLPAAN